MPKFFIDRGSISSEGIRITGEDVVHIKKVLRLKCGDTIVLCDGAGHDYNVSIERFEQDSVLTKVLSSVPNHREPPVSISLFQGIPKSDKMDYIIQKSVELGITRIVPVMTERTIVRIENAKDAENKVSRWQRISLEAAKQCNRGVVPRVEFPVTYETALKQMQDSSLSIMPYEKETGSRLRDCLEKYETGDVSVFIGPEGGFSEKEAESALASGMRTVSLGPRILRTETAGIMVLSILMYVLGDVG